MPTPLNINNAPYNSPQVSTNNVPPLHDLKSDQIGERRSVFSPDPSMGLPPRWNVGDLPQSYSSPVLLLTAAVGNGISAVFNPQANSVELSAKFADDLTSCSILVYSVNDISGDSQLVATFNNVSLTNCSNLCVGEFDQDVSLGGLPIQVAITNYAGIGPITVGCKRLN